MDQSQWRSNNSMNPKIILKNIWKFLQLIHCCYRFLVIFILFRSSSGNMLVFASCACARIVLLLSFYWAFAFAYRFFLVRLVFLQWLLMNTTFYVMWTGNPGGYMATDWATSDSIEVRPSKPFQGREIDHN